jgi:hypothetical protein
MVVDVSAICVANGNCDANKWEFLERLSTTVGKNKTISNNECRDLHVNPWAPKLTIPSKT